MAQRYSTRPSQFVSGLNEFQSLTLDFAAASEGWKQEAEARRKAERR